MKKAFNACEDLTKHTGGKKHKGHDRCIKLLKFMEATVRQAKVAPEKTKRYRIRMATADSPGRERRVVVSEVQGQTSIQREGSAEELVPVPSSDRIAGSAPMAMSGKRRRSRANRPKG